MPLTSPERRRLCHVSTPAEQPHAVASWLASVPAGTTGTAGELLQSFLTTSPRYGAPRTPIALGQELARLGVARAMRRGTSVWTLAPMGAAPLLVMPWH